jgi:hypothetical protein
LRISSAFYWLFGMLTKVNLNLEISKKMFELSLVLVGITSLIVAVIAILLLLRQYHHNLEQEE